MLGSGSHWRMLEMVGAASTTWVALMLFDAGKEWIFTLFSA